MSSRRPSEVDHGRHYLLHSDKAPARRIPCQGLLPLIAPSLVLVFFFAIPMGMMIGISFQSPTEGSPTLASYSRFFSNDLVLAGLARTVVMSGLVAFCVTVLAYPLAYYLARSTSRWRTVIFALAIAPELAGSCFAPTAGSSFSKIAASSIPP